MIKGAGPNGRANRKAAVEARLVKVADLVVSGASILKISTELCVHRNTTRKDINILVKRWQADQLPEDRHRWRSIELEKLQGLEHAVMPKALAGDLPAVDRALRVQERRSRLLGLDAPAPEKEDFIMEGEGIDAAIANALKQLAEREQKEHAKRDTGADTSM